MILSEYEAKLKSINPRFRIKRYGPSRAGIHWDNIFICAIPQGEISLYTVYKVEYDNHDQYKTPMNPTGGYRWKRIIKRGRIDAAKILAGKRFILYSDIHKIT